MLALFGKKTWTICAAGLRRQGGWWRGRAARGLLVLGNLPRPAVSTDTPAQRRAKQTLESPRRGPLDAHDLGTCHVGSRFVAPACMLSVDWHAGEGLGILALFEVVWGGFVGPSRVVSWSRPSVYERCAPPSLRAQERAAFAPPSMLTIRSNSKVHADLGGRTAWPKPCRPRRAHPPASVRVPYPSSAATRTSQSSHDTLVLAANNPDIVSGRRSDQKERPPKHGGGGAVRPEAS